MPPPDHQRDTYLPACLLTYLCRPCPALPCPALPSAQPVCPPALQGTVPWLPPARTRLGAYLPAYGHMPLRLGPCRYNSDGREEMVKVQLQGQQGGAGPAQATGAALSPGAEGTDDAAQAEAGSSPTAAAAAEPVQLSTRQRFPFLMRSVAEVRYAGRRVPEGKRQLLPHSSRVRGAIGTIMRTGSHATCDKCGTTGAFCSTQCRCGRGGWPLQGGAAGEGSAAGPNPQLPTTAFAFVR